ncbi:Prophage endopeptidase tail [Streptococcus gordonii]|uniref:phage tail protein n=1 Tax=Streptococcus gordonii TaxID=1302 RepID=UPI000FA36765|nr:phage tail protein [Streptococcus gordonii]RSJ32903.1 Prophage endopeptidase tail [Streptococcus gordonii]
MITFLDEKDNEYNAQVAYSTTSSVNGELSIKGTIYTNQKVLHGIDRGWRLRLDDEYYRIIYAKPNDTGRQIEVEFDAVHQFFYDMSKMSLYEILEGSKPIRTYLDAIFKGTSYRYVLEVEVGSIRKENFGNKSRLNLFNDLIKHANLEFSVSGHVVRILKNIGTDQSAIVRKNFNMNELTIEKDINSFVTYQRGLGMWKDEENHDLGRYEAVYESPLAQIYGRIEAEPVVDERYKETGKLLERLKTNVDNSYKVSISIDMEDLTKAGYKLSEPRAGDYIMAVNETLGLRKKIRIVSLISEYDVSGKLISRKVTCNDIGSVKRNSGEMSTLSRSVNDSLENSSRALDVATQALTSADGKNTNYFGDKKPADIPKGTLKKGDRLFLTVGDKKVLYFWNGAEWELEPTEFDSDKFNAEFDRKAETINKNIQQLDNKASEALTKAGAIIDSQELLDKINAHLLSDANNDDDGILGRKFRQQREANRSTRNIATSTRDKLTDYQRTNDENLVRIGQQLDNTVSKAEMKQTADGIRETIAKITVGARNLMVGTKDFSGDWFNKSKWTLEQEKYLGLSVYSRQEEWLGLSEVVEVRLGETYTFSAYVKSSIENDLVFMYLDNRLVEPRATLSLTRKDISVGTNWTRVSATFEVTKAGLMTPRFERNNKNAKLYVAGYKLELGNVPSDWSQAIEDTNQIIDDKITTFDRTLDGIRATVAEVKSYIDADGQRRQELNQLIRDETAKGISTVLSTVEQSGYAKRTEIQSITETQRLYDRIIGTTEDGIKQNIARMTLTDSLFQTEVSKAVNKELTPSNYVANPFTMSDYVRKYTGKGDSFTVTLVSSGINVFGKLELHAHSKLFYSDAIWLPLTRIPESVKDLSFSIIIDGIDKCKISVYVGTERSSTYINYKRQDNTLYGTLTGINSDYRGSDGVYLKLSFEGLNGQSVFLQKPIVVEGREPKFDFEINKRTEIDQAVRTLQTQLAGSWSVKNINSAGDLISGINLGADGKNRIIGKLTHITNETLMDRASIKSAAIESITADQITTGTLNASRINVINLNARSITSGTFRGLEYEGGIIRGNNGNTVINLNTNVTTYNGIARIEFKSPQNCLVYSSGGTQAFLTPTQRNGTSYAAWALGVGGSTLDTNANFTGIKIFNDPGAREVILIGDVRFVKDTFTRNAPATALTDILSQIQYNFVQIKNWFQRSDLGYPGLYDIGL